MCRQWKPGAFYCTVCRVITEPQCPWRGQMSAETEADCEVQACFSLCPSQQFWQWIISDPPFGVFQFYTLYSFNSGFGILVSSPCHDVLQLARSGIQAVGGEQVRAWGVASSERTALCSTFRYSLHWLSPELGCPFGNLNVRTKGG